MVDPTSASTRERSTVMGRGLWPGAAVGGKRWNEHTRNREQGASQSASRRMPGVVTSLALVCSRLASHVCIMFKFHLNLKWGFVKPSESFLEMTQIKIAPKRFKKMFM